MQKTIEQITTDKLLHVFNNPEYRIIDVRPVDAYNGWQLLDEKRGGHIPNAKSLPLKWTKYFDWLDIVQSKNINPHHNIILYGYNEHETDNVSSHFIRAGYQHLSVYNQFRSEWVNNNELPLSRLQRYTRLVPAQLVHTLITEGAAPEINNSKVVIAQAFYVDKNVYDKGHIPGAVALDTNMLEDPKTWNRRTPEELKESFEKLGITCDTTVILYGHFGVADVNDPFPGSSAGHLGAMRCAFLMMYAGVKDVRIINGGLQAWVDEGYSLSKENTTAVAVNDFGTVIPQNPHLAVDTKEAKEILSSKDKNLVCVRSWREYIGETSGYNYIRKKGRIPGAVFANCGSDAYHMENYQNVDHTTREYHEIEKMWADASLTSQKHNSFYCGTGWRASEAFINAYLMGWDNISIYDGGWFEWSNDDSNPYEIGIPSIR